MMLIKLCLIVGWFSLVGALFGEFAFGHMFDMIPVVAAWVGLFVIIIVSVLVSRAGVMLLIEYDDWMERRK